MFGTKPKAEPCVLTGKRHKYEWLRDVTIRNERHGPNGSSVRLSARAEYKCACGKVRLGASKGGL